MSFSLQKSLTVICIDCTRNCLSLMEDQLRQLPFVAKGKYLTSLEVGNPTPGSGVEVIKIPKICSTERYSEFCHEELPDYIDTKMCLIVQWDGFILRPERFEAAFFDYDYIGAPVRWNKGPLMVGNGGFCARSKKLLDFCKGRYTKHHYEDAVICLDPAVQEQFQIAPIDLGARFSESLYVQDKAWGFHHIRILDRYTRQRVWPGVQCLVNGAVKIDKIRELLGQKGVKQASPA